MTLRIKLVAGIVAVIVALCIVVGVITEIALSRFLVHQKDVQLAQAQYRVFPQTIRFPPGGVAGTLNTSGVRAPDGTGTATTRNLADGGGPVPTGTVAIAPAGTVAAAATGVTTAAGAAVTTTAVPAICEGSAGNPSRGALFRTAPGTLAVEVSGGQVVLAGIFLHEGQCGLIDSADLARLAGLHPGAAPQTVSIAGQGEFRVVATTLPNGDVGVTGLSLSDVDSTLGRLELILVAVSLGALLSGGLVVFFLVRRTLRPLERVASTARRVSLLPLDTGAVDLAVRVPDRDTDPRTEVGQVGTALNQMLGHVSKALQARYASEQRIRQFVADASHELRTPLAAIRGYAELAERAQSDAATVAHALTRVQSASQRMTALVDDLLLLARLDSGRPLDRSDVDLTMLAIDAVADARAAGPDHQWRLDLPDEPVATIGDQPRLYQVLANLLANARTHTPPGTTVITSVRSADGAAELAVSDDGPGIPEQAQAEVFGRFYRGDWSRSRSMGSTGLGLAIVSAVVAAHHGSVELDSRPGHTTFRVRLPAAATSADPDDPGLPEVVGDIEVGPLDEVPLDQVGPRDEQDAPAR